MSSDEPSEDEGGTSAPSQRDTGPPPSGDGRRPVLIPPMLGFYGVLMGIALGITLWTGDPLLPYVGNPGPEGFRPFRDLTAGLLAGGLVLALSNEFIRHTRSGAAFADALAELIGPLSQRDCLVLAVVSGVVEECLFRGALQPIIGLVPAALVFGLVHFVPRRDLAPWCLFGVAAGLLLGVLFDTTGNLVAPVVAHALINAVNLRRLSHRPAANS